MNIILFCLVFIACVSFSNALEESDEAFTSPEVSTSLFPFYGQSFSLEIQVENVLNDPRMQNTGSNVKVIVDQQLNYRDLLGYFDKADENGDKFLTESEVDEWERKSGQSKSMWQQFPSYYDLLFSGDKPNTINSWTALVNFANKHRAEVKMLPRNPSGSTSVYPLVRKVYHYTDIWSMRVSHGSYGSYADRNNFVHIRGGEFTRTDGDSPGEQLPALPRYFVVTPGPGHKVFSVNYANETQWTKSPLEVGEPAAFTNMNPFQFYDVLLVSEKVSNVQNLKQCYGFNVNGFSQCYLPVKVNGSYNVSSGSPTPVSTEEPDMPPGGYATGGHTALPGSPTVAPYPNEHGMSVPHESLRAVPNPGCSASREKIDFFLSRAPSCRLGLNADRCDFGTGRCFCIGGASYLEAVCPVPDTYYYDAKPPPPLDGGLYDYGYDYGYDYPIGPDGTGPPRNSRTPVLSKGVIAGVGVGVFLLLVLVVLAIYCLTSGAAPTEPIEVPGGVVGSGAAAASPAVVSSSPVPTAAPLSALCGACGQLIRYVRPAGHVGAVDVPCSHCQATNRLAQQAPVAPVLGQNIAVAAPVHDDSLSSSSGTSASSSASEEEEDEIVRAERAGVKRNKQKRRAKK